MLSILFPSLLHNTKLLKYISQAFGMDKFTQSV